MTPDPVDLKATFDWLRANDERERTFPLGDVYVRLVRVVAGGEGRWDSHQDGPETVVVSDGTFKVEFRDRTLVLTAGQCCVVPSGADHRGTSPTGADVVLFRAGEVS